MRHKALFLDIDGTLTAPGSNTPPESAIQAIEAARREGHKVFLCTGRNYQMLSPLLRYGFDGMVASSGGYIRCGGEVIYDCPMTDAQRDTAFDVLSRNGIYRTIECMDGSFTDEGFKEFLMSRDGGNSELLRWRKQLETSLGIRPMKEYDGQPVYKIVIMLQKEDQLEEPMRVLGGEFDFCMQDRDAYGIINGEVVNRKFDKGQGVARVCRHLGIDMTDSVGVGDSANDAAMLRACGLAVCMANGSESAKKLADVICPSVDEDGIRWTLEKYVIKQNYKSAM